MSDRESTFKLALELPPKDRAELAERLLASLDGPDEILFEDECVEECERRMKAVERGEMGTVDGEEVIRRMKNGERP
jgi:putative addiction module component (TIGR02574 family)